MPVLHPTSRASLSARRRIRADFLSFLLSSERVTPLRPVKLRGHVTPPTCKTLSSELAESDDPLSSQLETLGDSRDSHFLPQNTKEPV